MAIRDIEPVFIWAPTARNGVTLLQRLISSSREVLVFGENHLFTIHLLGNLASVDGLGERADESRARLARGDVNFWASAAQPDKRVYRRAVIEAFYSLAGAYQRSAEAEGCRTFGIKEPAPDWGVIELLLNILPNARHIFIYRDVRDVLKSYKSRGWIADMAALRSTAQRWAANAMRMRALDGDARFLVIRYETMLAERDAFVAKLAAYIKARSIDPAVFDHKVNTFSDQGVGERKSAEYVAPIELNAAEMAAILETAGPALKALGYM